MNLTNLKATGELVSMGREEISSLLQLTRGEIQTFEVEY